MIYSFANMLDIAKNIEKQIRTSSFNDERLTNILFEMYDNKLRVTLHYLKQSKTAFIFINIVVTPDNDLSMTFNCIDNSYSYYDMLALSFFIGCAKVALNDASDELLRQQKEALDI